MMTWMLAAAAATAQPGLANDPDLRCLAAYLVAAGNANEDATVSADDKAGIQSIVMYFFGKIDARKPGADLGGEIQRLVGSPEYARTLRPDIERCSAEAETRAKYLGALGEQPEGSPTGR